MLSLRTPRLQRPGILVFSLAGAAPALSQWPVQLADTRQVFSPPAMADIDGDGRVEVVALVPRAFVGAPEGLYAFRADGRELIDGDGDPSTNGVLLALELDLNSFKQPVTLGNLDGDPEPEILFYAQDHVFAVNADGSAVPGAWPLPFPNVSRFNQCPITVADLDRDGVNEVLFAEPFDPTAMESRFHVRDASGNAWPGFPLRLPRATFGTHVHVSVVTNLTGDAALEIVLVSYPLTSPAGIFAFDHDGAQLWHVDRAVIDLVGGDLDGDGDRELLGLEPPSTRPVQRDYVTRLLRIGGDGTLEREHVFPIGPVTDQPPRTFLYGGVTAYALRESEAWVGPHISNDSSPDLLFIGQVDGAPGLEASFSTRYFDSETYVDTGFLGIGQRILEHRGEAVVFSLVAESRVPGFPLRFTYDQPIASTREPVRSVDRLVDVDGDGRAEILTSEVQRLTGLEQTHTTVRIHDSTGLEVGRNVFVATLPWSFGLGIPGLRRGEVADLDLDGRYDFAVPVPQAELHVQPLALPSTPQADPQGPPLSRPADWPTFRQNLQRTGALD